MLDQFAEELRLAREKEGISLQQMALKTRIDIKFLDAIDRGDFSFLPETYVKAFLKDYSKIVGLDENKTIQKYEAAKKGQIVEDKTEDEQVPAAVKKELRKKVHYDATPPPPSAHSGSTLNKSIIGNILIVGGGILIVYILYLIFIKESTDIVVEEKPIEEIIEDNQQRFEEPASVADNIKLSDSLNLTIFSADTSWVQIIYDDKKKDDFTLFPNSYKTIKADANFKITLGNSGPIRFQLNNQPLNFTGKRGAVSYIQINREGLTILQNPPSLNINE